MDPTLSLGRMHASSPLTDICQLSCHVRSCLTELTKVLSASTYLQPWSTLGKSLEIKQEKHSPKLPHSVSLTAMLSTCLALSKSLFVSALTGRMAVSSPDKGRVEGCWSQALQVVELARVYCFPLFVFFNSYNIQEAMLAWISGINHVCDALGYTLGHYMNNPKFLYEDKK